jgi:hypothetical protein
MNQPSDFLSDLDELESAEDFLSYFAIGYDAGLVQRKHIQLLRLYQQLLSRVDNPDFQQYKQSLQVAYQQISLGREPVFNHTNHCAECGEPCEATENW